jgi:hypothetical protein
MRAGARNAAFMRHGGTTAAQTLARASRRSGARRTPRTRVRNGAPGRVNAAFQFASGTPHLCGTSRPQPPKRSRGRRIGPGFGPCLQRRRREIFVEPNSITIPSPVQGRHRELTASPELRESHLSVRVCGVIQEYPTCIPLSSRDALSVATARTDSFSPRLRRTR